jgi:hypothetical protein
MATGSVRRFGSITCLDPIEASERRTDRPLLRRPVRVRPRRLAGGRGVQAACDLPRSGVRQPVPLPPPGRNRRDPFAAASTVMSAGHCAGGHRPVRWPLCGQQVSTTRAASPVGVRTRAARRPSATAALRRRCPPWCPAAGRVDRWADTPTLTVPAGRTCEAVGVRPPRPPRRWGRTAADTPGRSRRCRPGWLSGFQTPADSLPHPAMACVGT